MSRGGRQYGRAHLPVESCHSVSAWGVVVYAQMWGDDDDFDIIEWTFSADWALIDFTRDGRRWSQSIRLTWMFCRYGGRRRWFLCPQCGRRVGKVYLPTTMYWNYALRERVNVFRCRHCFDLTYEQRRDRDLSWAYQHRAARIAQRWFADVTDEMIYRPKGMHWQTFNRRADQYNALIEAADGYIMASIQRVLARFSKP